MRNSKKVKIQLLKRGLWIFSLSPERLFIPIHQFIPCHITSYRPTSSPLHSWNDALSGTLRRRTWTLHTRRVPAGKIFLSYNQSFFLCSICNYCTCLSTHVGPTLITSRQHHRPRRRPLLRRRGQDPPLRGQSSLLPVRQRQKSPLFLFL